MMMSLGGATAETSVVERMVVVVLSPFDVSGDLGLTVLWRSDVQRVMVATVAAAVDVARVRRPTMVVVGGLAPAAAAACLQQLRADDATRQSALAVLCPPSALDQEEALRAAGANVVLPTPVMPGTIAEVGKTAGAAPNGGATSPATASIISVRTAILGSHSRPILFLPLICSPLLVMACRIISP